MARIAGVDLPKDKRIEIGLTYVYGIGRTSAKKILDMTGINPDLFGSWALAYSWMFANGCLPGA